MRPLNFFCWACLIAGTLLVFLGYRGVFLPLLLILGLYFWLLDEIGKHHFTNRRPR